MFFYKILKYVKNEQFTGPRSLRKKKIIKKKNSNLKSHFRTKYNFLIRREHRSSVQIT